MSPASEASMVGLGGSDFFIGRIEGMECHRILFARGTSSFVDGAALLGCPASMAGTWLRRCALRRGHYHVAGDTRERDAAGVAWSCFRRGLLVGRRAETVGARRLGLGGLDALATRGDCLNAARGPRSV